MKIFCIGRNYALHAKEMNAEIPSRPVVFMKPDTSLVKNNEAFYYPDFSKNIHYECELVIKIGKSGKNISEAFATDYISEYTLGIDLTARDLQAELKKKGHPWEIAKAFDRAAPIGEFLPANKDIDWNDVHFTFEVNGEERQVGNTNKLIFSIPYLIHYLSTFFTLNKGDLIFTGTPEGVGPIEIGDQLTAKLDNKTLLTCEVK